MPTPLERTESALAGITRRLNEKEIPLGQISAETGIAESDLRIQLESADALTLPTFLSVLDVAGLTVADLPASAGLTERYVAA
jgi:hypothetical protein